MRFKHWLVLVATALAVGCSCAERKSARELSAYWNGHDFTSLDGFDEIDAAEEKFDGYIDLLSRVPHDVAVREMTEFLDSAAQNVVGYMVWSSWFEPYLHALQSPYRDDELFVAWLDKVLADKVIDDGAQMEHLEMMSRCMSVNRVGMAPQETQVRTEDGGECLLSDFAGTRTLMLFVDADCPSCLEGLNENSRTYAGTDTQLLAVLVNGSSYHLDNIRRQLPPEVLGRWTFVCRGASSLEENLYDLSLLPFRILVSPEWIIEKTYY